MKNFRIYTLQKGIVKETDETEHVALLGEMRESDESLVKNLNRRIAM